MNEPDFFTTSELQAKKAGTFACDVESFSNYFLVAFKCFDTGKLTYFEAKDNEAVPIDWIAWMLHNYCVVGFNFKNYDLIIISMALAGYGVAALKIATHELIVEGLSIQDLQKKYKFQIVACNNVDLIEVAPLKGSLKLYAARLHCRHMQDLPFDPDTELTRQQIAITRTYCFNDLDNTLLLARELNQHLELRYALSLEFNKDLRSRSDAQLAQEIINGEIARITGTAPKRQDFTKLVGTSFYYEPPAYIEFASIELEKALFNIMEQKIVIGSSGHVQCPKEIEGRKIVIDGKAYTIGMGGLHSREQRQALVSGELRILDRDVTGYYPNMILKNKFSDIPGELEALQTIVNKRYAAKKSGNMVVADSLKIASNGSFGKKSDPYSTLYSPKMMVQTTLTGQLSLLMAIERLHLAGFQVVSANTDGIVTLCPQERYDEYVAIFKQWEIDTGLETEETEYAALYSRDVNNYIAIKPDGKFKAKGVYSEKGSALNSPLSRNPTAMIAIDAAVAKLTKGVEVAQTVHECQDIRRFVIVRNVTGGAQKDGRYLGKTIRWYYATGVLGEINRCTKGDKVPLSDGGKPLMTLPDFLPTDIDYARYVQLATEILEDVGFQHRKNEQLLLLDA